jgi:hypothetical protein
VDQAVAVEEFGAALGCGPLFGTVYLAIPALVACASTPARDELLAALVEGERTAAFAINDSAGGFDPNVTVTAVGSGDAAVLTGTAARGVDAPAADVVLLAARGSDGVSHYDGDAPDVRRIPLVTMDLTRPQADVKHRAWREVIEDDTLPNATARAIIAGWAQPGQGELLASYTEQYFHTIGGVWERRSSEVAQTVVVGLYPNWDVSAAGLEAADEFLGGLHVPPALRRLVLEGRAGVERALRARAFDAS